MTLYSPAGIGRAETTVWVNVNAEAYWHEVASHDIEQVSVSSIEPEL